MKSIHTSMWTCAAVGVLAATGCATSRLDQLHAKSARVESALRSEQAKVLENAYAQDQRQNRLNRLSELRATLSAANVGLGVVKYLPEEQRDTGYDVLDEVYGTIEWNIPLAPNDKPKPLPAQFSGGQLNLK